MMKTKKTFPELDTDAELESFVENANLSEYDFSQFKPIAFELDPENTSIAFEMKHALRPIDTIKNN